MSDVPPCSRCERLSDVLSSARSQVLAHLSARLKAECEVIRLQTELSLVKAGWTEAQKQLDQETQRRKDMHWAISGITGCATDGSNAVAMVDALKTNMTLSAVKAIDKLQAQVHPPATCDVCQRPCCDYHTKDGQKRCVLCLAHQVDKLTAYLATEQEANQRRGAENRKLRLAIVKFRDTIELTNNHHHHHQAVCDLNAALAPGVDP